MKHIVLAGGGHAHALLIQQLINKPLANIRWTCISDHTYSLYSGMLPGVIAGHYAQPDMFIPLQDLCARAGVEFIQAEISGVNGAGKSLQLQDGRNIGFDFLSLALGATPLLSKQDNRLLPVKPLPQFLQTLGSLNPQVPTDVVGGGIASIEVALALAWRWREQQPNIRIISRSSQLLPEHNWLVRRKIQQRLTHAGITLQTGTSVSAEFPLQAQAIDCSPASGHPALHNSDLTLQQGFIPINAYLQNPQFPWIFAAGDNAQLQGRTLAKAGVYAVRQAPVLFHNLIAITRAQVLRNYQPQSQFLTLIACGEKYAVASKGLFFASGHWAWRWKDNIDKKFMAEFRS
jgi:selenide, water dikinase